MSDELIGGRYRVIDCLRKTGFCETYVAQDTHLPGDPRCVVKKLQPQSNENFVLDTARRLFRNEASVLYKLNNHPQIPRLLAHMEQDEQFYLVQEFIEGKDLSQTEIVPDNLWQEQEVINFLKEVLEILAFVHQNNVIHRDIKPSNLIRRKSDGKIILIDFGAVKEISNMTLTEGQGNLLTVAIGTPGYMASEQQRGDPRFNSDIYALGITAIQALTGFHPDQLPRDRDTGEIDWRGRAKNCSNALADILDIMVRNDFRERYQNANEALDALQKLGKGKSNPIPPPIPPSPKKFLWLAIIPLVLGLLFLSPRIWKALQALKYYNEGNTLIEEGELQKAIEAFNSAVQNRPDFAQAWTNRGFAQGKLGRHVEKFSSCAQATNVAPDFAEAWNCRGLARYDLKQYEEALKEYNQAIAVDPEFYRGWYNKGQVLLKLGKPQEAIEATRQVLKIKPDYFLAWTQLCRALYELEQYQDAKAHCEESRDINPNYKQTLELLQQVEQKLQQ
jgi:serine/threonine protein kinase